LTALAAEQFAELAAGSDGAIEVVATTSGDDSMTFTISLDTRGIPTSNGGIRVRARERFDIIVGSVFPYKPPSVMVHHRRWAGMPHVQWARVLCLYAAPEVEWNPADGMRGLVARLNLWLQRAAEGTLDPDGQPLHPPVTYSSYDAGWIIVNPDLGELVPWRDQVTCSKTELLYAWCSRNGERVDVIEWLKPLDAYDRVLADNFEPEDDKGFPYFVAPVLLVSDELGMEYPDKAATLAGHLEESGVSRDELLRSFTGAGTFNRAIGSMAGATEEAPTVVLLGTPARRVEGSRRLAHITAWRLDDLGEQITSLLGEVQRDNSALTDKVRSLADKWLGFADVTWMVVHENRPEVMRRRDTGSPATWLIGKRVLVLGCGALGAPIAEQCVRGGVRELTVADKSTVKPGILIRQPYTDADIGYNKARVLAKRLNKIRRDLAISPVTGDVLALFLGEDAVAPDFDLVIDATADVGVRTALEVARGRRRDNWPPVITGLFGHEATRGIVMVSHRGATGAAHDMLRRIAIDARGSVKGSWAAMAEDFFPNPPRTEMFFPEPGCSAPTFTGSAIQTTALASLMFWAAVNELDNPESDDPMVATAVRLPGAEAAPAGSGRLVWPDDAVLTELTARFEVRVSQRAITEMRGEVRRGARVRGPRVETGGMLLGAFDEATRCVYVDVVTGPSPDSALSEGYFDHGTAGTQELVDHHRARTSNQVGFVGLWHTHPYGRAWPSPTDEAGMAWIVSPDGTGRRALMMILGGPEARWNAWRDAGELPDIYVCAIDRQNGAPPPDGLPTQIAPAGTYFPGGYYYPDSYASGSGHRRWWQFLTRPRA
jgi:integrative and conjugative element protein (TIGR02256 family)